MNFLVITTLTLFCVVLGGKDVHVTRKLSTILNPGCNISQHPICNSTSSNPSNVVYTKASMSDGNTIHYLWSSLNGFSLLAAQTDNSSSIEIDWDNVLFESGTIKIKNLRKTDFVYGVVISKLIEYNDVKDEADFSKVNMSNPEQVRLHDLSSLNWRPVNLEGNGASFSLANSSLYLGNRTTPLFKVRVHSEGSRSTVMPRMEVTENTTSLILTIDGIRPTFMHSRFVVEVYFISNIPGDDVATLNKKKCLDDEYTPGVFSLFNLESKHSESSENVYIQWKPVSYFASDLSLEALTKAVSYVGEDPVNVTVNPLPKSIVYGYFGDKITKKTPLDQRPSISLMRVAFGNPEDKFYNRNFFSSWTMNVGVGIPPEDVVGTTIIVIFAVGFGIPFLLVLLAPVIVCVRKKRAKRATYERIND